MLDTRYWEASRKNIGPAVEVFEARSCCHRHLIRQFRPIDSLRVGRGIIDEHDGAHRVRQRREIGPVHEIARALKNITGARFPTDHEMNTLVRQQADQIEMRRLPCRNRKQCVRAKY